MIRTGSGWMRLAEQHHWNRAAWKPRNTTVTKCSLQNKKEWWASVDHLEKRAWSKKETAEEKFKAISWKHQVCSVSFFHSALLRCPVQCSRRAAASAQHFIISLSLLDCDVVMVCSYSSPSAHSAVRGGGSAAAAEQCNANTATWYVTHT